MLRSRSIVKSVLSLGILFLMVAHASQIFAQEGIISSVYIAERTALQKMHAARKAGNEEEVQRLSAEIKELVNQKKSWANDLLTLTESSITKIQNDNAPDLSEEQRTSLLRRIEEKKSQKRILELQLEERLKDSIRERVELETVQKGIEERVVLRSESPDMVEEFVRDYKSPR